MSPEEVPLPGNATVGVVRVGDTVRRPAGPWTDSVDAVLRHLREVGFTACPRPMGRDEQGRQVLEYVPGEVGEAAGTLSGPQLTSVGRMLRELHEALRDYAPAPEARWQRLIPPDREELICHNDVAPWNLVGSDRGWVLIDWDATAPGSRLWDLGYAAQSMAGLRADRPVAECASRLRAFADGYAPGPELRAGLPAMLGRRASAMHDMLRKNARRPPWSRIWVEDGPYWAATARYLDEHQDAWHGALR